MFGRRKKKYIKDFEGSAFKTSETIKKTSVSTQTKNSTDLSHSDRKHKKISKRLVFDAETLLSEDSILIQVEKSWFNNDKISKEVYKLAKESSQKPATGVLNAIAVILTLRFGYFLLNAEFLRVNSIIYIFILFVPFVIGMPIIFEVTFKVWKRFFSPMARVVSRKVFKYWLLILFALYMILFKNILG